MTAADRVVTAADRVQAERAAQGLPTPAGPIGDDVIDARVASAYRATATLLAPASAAEQGTAAPSSVSDGAAVVGVGELTRSAAASCSTTDNRQKARGSHPRASHDNSGQRAAAGEV